MRILATASSLLAKTPTMEGSSTSPEWLRYFRVNTNTCVAIAGGAVAVAPAAAAGLLFFFFGGMI